MTSSLTPKRDQQDITITLEKSERSVVTQLTWKVDFWTEYWFMTSSVAMFPLEHVVKELSLETGTGKTPKLPCTWRFQFFAPRDGVIGIEWKLMKKSARIKGDVEAAFEFDVTFKSKGGESQEKTLKIPRGPRSKLPKSWCSKMYCISYDYTTFAPKIIQIRVEVFDDDIDNPRNVEIPDGPVSKKARLLPSNSKPIKPTDFKIKASDGKEFPVHKAILASNSSVFSEMIKSTKKKGAKANSGTIQISDLTSKAMELILNIIYSGSSLSMGNNNWMPIAEELIRAGEKYKLKTLMDFLNTNLVDICNPVNALQLLKNARKYKLKKAEENINTWITENLNKEEILHAFLADVE